MRTTEDIDAATQALKAYKTAGDTVALVPTMGNLHAGHLALVKRAKKEADKVAVSIFVNPMQFGPTEDFDSYPRTLIDDLRQLEAAGVDLVFTPSMEAIYPAGVAAATKVVVPTVTEVLEGAHRPDFFTGVASIVCKLFHILPAHMAVFGKKDYQQLQVIRQMVSDLNFQIDIIAAETVRETDGLAMSSRNMYLSQAERATAPALYQALQAARKQLLQGEAVKTVEEHAGATLSAKGFEVDYFSVVRQADLTPAKTAEAVVIVVAAKLGSTRLIDNLEV